MTAIDRFIQVKKRPCKVSLEISEITLAFVIEFSFIRCNVVVGVDISKLFFGIEQEVIVGTLNGVLRVYKCMTASLLTFIGQFMLLVVPETFEGQLSPCLPIQL